MCSWLARNHALNTGVAIFHIQVKMLNVAHAQPSVSHEEEEIQNSNF